MREVAKKIVLTLLLGAFCACGSRSPEAGAPPAGAEPRIVVLSPALAVVLCDLGLRDRIVGRHGYDLVLDASVPVCGQQSGIEYEAVLRARPTHVLTEWGSRELPRRLEELAAERGWTLRDFRLLSLADIDAAALALEQMFPGASPSARTARIHGLASGARERVWSGRVLLLMGAAPIDAIGPGSAHQELLERVGGVPAIAEGSPYMQLHAEDVLRLAPDAIVLLRPREGGPESPGARPDLGVIDALDIPAVREGRIAVIDLPLALLPSTGLADVADRLGEFLEAWAGE